MEQKVFDREFFVEEGRKGGKKGGKDRGAILRAKYGEDYFHKISKLGVMGKRKKNRDIL